MDLSTIDKTRASRTEDELRALVDAIHTSPAGTQETNWLEWKSALDLGTPEGRFAVAKAILGFANREVAQAQLACEGVAYMVVGVEPGAAAGVLTFDHATLGQKIRTYADTPRWTPQYVQFSGVTVLVIVVEAPRPGDPVHTLQKEFTKGSASYRAGTIFHRGAAHTEPAGPKEIAMLQERLLHGALRPDLALDLTVSAEPLMRLFVNEDQVQDWCRRHEAFVRDNSGEPPPPSQPTVPAPARYPQLGGIPSFRDVANIGGIGSLLAGSSATAENREKFERRVTEHMSHFTTRHIVDNALRLIVRSEENTVCFTAGNETADAVMGVQLMVVIPGNGLVVCAVPPPASPLPRSLPRWPDPVLDRIRSVEVLPPLAEDHVLPRTAAEVVDKDGVFEAAWEIGDLRPGERSRPRSLTIVAGPGAPDEVEIQLMARSKSHRGNARSRETLTIATDQWTLDHWPPI